MNPKLPKPIQEALARQAGGEIHPSADALTSFQEHTLPYPERQLVINHLAQCADCREIVFLASSAAEEPAAIEEDLLADDAIHRLSPVYAAKAQLAHLSVPTASMEAPRRKWALRLVWAVPVAAAVLLASGVLVQHRFATSPPKLASTVASNVPGVPVAGTEHVVTDQVAPSSAVQQPPAEARAKKPPTTSVPPKTTLNALAMSGESSQAAKEWPAPSSGKAASSHETPSALPYVGGKVAASAPLRNTFAESSDSEVAAAGASLAKPQASMRGIAAARVHWRITPEGHLERSTAPNQWTRQLGEQSTNFRVVSVIGDDVWAGGNGGALFHSSDGGQHWRPVILTTGAGSETAAIVSIRFGDPQHGIIITDSGLQWNTSDGGLSWGKQ